MNCGKTEREKKKKKEISRETMRKRSNDETRDKNVNGYNCCGCGCGEDVWCLVRVNCTRGRGRGREERVVGGRVTRVRGVADVILGAQGDFVGWFRGFQLLFESFRLPFGDGSRVSRLQRTTLLLPPCRFDLPFSEFRHVREAPCSDE